MITDDEREKRVQLVGKYFEDNPDTSTRKAADYFTNNFFKISNYTIYDYLQRYRKKDKEKAKNIDKIMFSNKSDSINKEEVLKRVKIVCKMYLFEKKNVDTIAHELNVSFWTIYNDLVHRSKKIDEDLYLEISKEMENRSNSNLNNAKKLS